MSSKCGKCNLDLKQSELAAKCTDCNVEFHPSCTDLGSQNFTKAKSKNWKCEKCSGGGSSSVRENMSTAIVDKKTLLEALNSFKLDIKQHTDAAVGSVISRLDTLKDELQALNNKFNSLDQKQSVLKDRCDMLERANAELTKEVRSLQVRLNDADQHSRCANIEILGIPETQGENVYAVLQNLATALGIKHQREDISIAHRLRLFSAKHAHPPIICQFVSRTVKELWMATARKKRNLKSTDISARLPASTVYVNEHLTGHSKALLGHARRLQREGRLHFAGYFNGKVLVKPRENDPAIRIICPQDLEKYEDKP
jgi:FtsZ-binding cell division protein ZapB